MSGGYIEPGDLDAALCDMIRNAVIDIVAWIADEGGGHQGSFTLDDVNWDHPTNIPDPVRDLLSGMTDNWGPLDLVGLLERVNKASHAIGFICGVATALDVTPMTLIGSYKRAAVQGFGDCAKCGRTLDGEGECRGGCSQPRPAKRAKRPTAKRRQKIRTIK